MTADPHLIGLIRLHDVLLQEVPLPRPQLAEPHVHPSPLPMTANLQLAMSAMDSAHGKALLGANAARQAHLPAIASSPANNLLARFSGSESNAFGNGPMASLGGLPPPYAIESAGMQRASLTRSIPLSSGDLGLPGPGDQLPYGGKLLSRTSNGAGDMTAGSCYTTAQLSAAAAVACRSTSSVAAGMPAGTMAGMTAGTMAGLTAGIFPAGGGGGGPGVGGGGGPGMGGGGGPGVMPGSWLDSSREREGNVNNFASVVHPIKSDVSMGSFIGEVITCSDDII